MACVRFGKDFCLTCHVLIDANRYNNSQDSPGIVWNSLQTTFLADCEADVLDCCNAFSAVRAARVVSPASAMLWVACSADLTTPQSGPTSFTENLIADLEDLGAEGMDVEEINTNVVIRMDMIQSYNKLLARNTPHCAPISPPHRPIRLKRLLHLRNTQLLDRAEPSKPLLGPGSGISGRPRRISNAQRRPNIVITEFSMHIQEAMQPALKCLLSMSRKTPRGLKPLACPRKIHLHLDFCTCCRILWSTDDLTRFQIHHTIRSLGFIRIGHLQSGSPANSLFCGLRGSQGHANLP